jgi:ankyrin repeat protein
LLLDGGADPNLQESNGNAALHEAAHRGLAEIVPLLIEHGAELDLENNLGKTALNIAEPNREEIAEMLRKAGARE